MPTSGFSSSTFRIGSCARGFEEEFIEGLKPVDFRRLEGNDGRNVALQIEQRRYLDGSILGAIRAPGKSARHGSMVVQSAA